MAQVNTAEPYFTQGAELGRVLPSGEAAAAPGVKIPDAGAALSDLGNKLWGLGVGFAAATKKKKQQIDELTADAQIQDYLAKRKAMAANAVGQAKIGNSVDPQNLLQDFREAATVLEKPDLSGLDPEVQLRAQAALTKAEGIQDASVIAGSYAGLGVNMANALTANNDAHMRQFDGTEQSTLNEMQRVSSLTSQYQAAYGKTGVSHQKQDQLGFLTGHWDMRVDSDALDNDSLKEDLKTLQEDTQSPMVTNLPIDVKNSYVRRIEGYMIRNDNLAAAQNKKADALVTRNTDAINQMTAKGQVLDTGSDFYEDSVNASNATNEDGKSLVTPDVRKKYQQAVADNADVLPFKSLSVADQRAEIQKLQAQPQDPKTARLVSLKTMQVNANTKQLNDDPLSYAAQTQGVNVAPIDMAGLAQNPDAAAKTWASRMQIYDGIHATQPTAQPKLFTGQEAQQALAWFTNPSTTSDQKLAFVNAMYKGTGSWHAVSVTMNQMNKDMGDTYTRAAEIYGTPQPNTDVMTTHWLKSNEQWPSPVDTARTIMNGAAYLQTPDAKNPQSTSNYGLTYNQEAFNTALGNAAAFYDFSDPIDMRQYQADFHAWQAWMTGKRLAGVSSPNAADGLVVSSGWRGMYNGRAVRAPVGYDETTFSDRLRKAATLFKNPALIGASVDNIAPERASAHPIPGASYYYFVSQDGTPILNAKGRPYGVIIGGHNGQ
jgi:hypothetical protein